MQTTPKQYPDYYILPISKRIGQILRPGDSASKLTKAIGDKNKEIDTKSAPIVI